MLPQPLPRRACSDARHRGTPSGFFDCGSALRHFCRRELGADLAETADSDSPYAQAELVERLALLAPRFDRRPISVAQCRDGDLIYRGFTGARARQITSMRLPGNARL